MKQVLKFFILSIAAMFIPFIEWVFLYVVFDIPEAVASKLFMTFFCIFPIIELLIHWKAKREMYIIEPKNRWEKMVQSAQNMYLTYFPFINYFILVSLLAFSLKSCGNQPV